MNADDPAFIYLTLILPSLFSLTLIAEGIHKTMQKESGWFSLVFGFFFLLAVVIFAYFFIFT